MFAIVEVRRILLIFVVRVMRFLWVCKFWITGFGLPVDMGIVGESEGRMVECSGPRVLYISEVLVIFSWRHLHLRGVSVWGSYFVWLGHMLRGCLGLMVTVYGQLCVPCDMSMFCGLLLMSVGSCLWYCRRGLG